MKPFARINLSSAALRRVILVSSLALVAVAGTAIAIAVRLKQIEAEQKAEFEEIWRDLRESVKESLYLGMTEEEMVAKFGSPHEPDDKYNEVGIYWHIWPEVERLLGAEPSNAPDTTVRELYWNCKTNVVVVWLVTSNGVWRVAKDITVEDGVVF